MVHIELVLVLQIVIVHTNIMNKSYCNSDTSSVLFEAIFGQF